MDRGTYKLSIAAVAGLAALAATPASARTYYVVQRNSDAWTVMDAEGVEGAGTALRKAWTVRVQRNILAGDPPQPGYVRTLTEFDCEQYRVRWREFTAFSRSGATLVSRVNQNPEWTPADGASDMRAAYRVVCNGGSGDSVISADSVAKVVIALMAAWDPPSAAAAPPIIATPVKPVPAKPGTKPAAAPPAPKAQAPTPAKAKAP